MHLQQQAVEGRGPSQRAKITCIAPAPAKGIEHDFTICYTWNWDWTLVTRSTQLHLSKTMLGGRPPSVHLHSTLELSNAQELSCSSVPFFSPISCADPNFFATSQPLSKVECRFRTPPPQQTFAELQSSFLPRQGLLADLANVQKLHSQP